MPGICRILKTSVCSIEKHGHGSSLLQHGPDILGHV
ncbi:hypothetical protein ES332_D05G423900v1 [Gossypium tomentosum]|uniref:Uncharacterized protein n=1 Tax=Gossypium tomentosum TaxID=34277 RepID=A0A5D2L6J4_GOSTO|nr:hypothetical protein ES332_D05G423900v1 [Gossypium tomentosum]